MSESPLSVVGQLRKIIYRKGDFVVALLDAETPLPVPVERVVLQHGGDIQTNIRLRLYGKLVLRRIHGFQFVASSFEEAAKPIRPAPPPAFKKPLLEALELGEVPGVGAETGCRLVKAFGSDLATLEEPAALATLTGIGHRRAFSILANIHRYIDEINQ